jgi:hypothetical protein
MLIFKQLKMSLQYISDSNGLTTGIFIPIDEWNEMKKVYNGIDKIEFEIPEWQKNIVRERLEEYRKDPFQAFDADSSLDEIEKEL